MFFWEYFLKMSKFQKKNHPLGLTWSYKHLNKRSVVFLTLLVGKLFHVDFGYILGRDPKLLPPLMKLTTEMIDGMGGPNSEHFHDFKKLCYTAFLAIRRYFSSLFTIWEKNKQRRRITFYLSVCLLCEKLVLKR